MEIEVMLSERSIREEKEALVIDSLFQNLVVVDNSAIGVLHKLKVLFLKPILA